MKRCTPLSPAARQLLELGSRVEPPTAEQSERMDRALAQLLALDRATPPAAPRLAQRPGRERHAGAGRAGEPSAAGRSLARLFGSGATPVVLALGALLATAGSAFWMGRASAPSLSPRASGDAALLAPSVLSRTPAVTLPASTPPAVTLPASTPPAATAAAATAPPALAPTAPGATATSSAAPRSSPAPLPLPAQTSPRRARARPPATGDLSAEIARLTRAEAALRHGRARAALAELEQPAAHLIEQAAALRAIAGCELARETGVERARLLLERWPGSAFAPRLRAACGL